MELANGQRLPDGPDIFRLLTVSNEQADECDPGQNEHDRRDFEELGEPGMRADTEDGKKQGKPGSPVVLDVNGME